VRILKLGNRIREIRKSKKLTQKQLAEKVGVSTVTITRYENNNREPNIETLKKIAVTFGVTINDLTELDNEYSRATSLSNTYYNSVMKWSEDRIFNDLETIGIREHFFDLLLRYKELLNSFSNAKYTWKNIGESYSHIYKDRKEPFSDAEIKELFLKQELETQIESLTNSVKAFPNWVVQRELELSNSKKSNNEIK